jgi:hypothetical protein
LDSTAGFQPHILAGTVTKAVGLSDGNRLFNLYTEHTFINTKKQKDTLLLTISMSIFFWIVMACGLTGRYQHFGGLKMGTARFSDIFTTMRSSNLTTNSMFQGLSLTL